MSPDSMASGWYYAKSGAAAGQEGPLDWQELYLRAQSGQFGPGDLVWNAQLPDWVPAAQIPGLFPAPTVQPAGPPVASGPGTAPPRRPIRLLAWLIPLIAIVVVGAGLGTYFGFFFHKGESTSAATVTTGAGGTTVTTQAAAAAKFKLPDQAKLVKTQQWGLVPADQICVMLADDQKPSDAAALAKVLGGTVVGELDFLNTYQIQIGAASEADLAKSLETARATTGVVLAVPNQTTTLAAAGEIWGTPISPLQDPAYAGASGEGYDLIGVQKAWDYLKGYGAGLLSPVQVGVVDSGLYAGNGQFDGGANVSYTDPSAQLSAPEQITYSDGTTGSDPAGGHGTGINTIIGADADDGGPAGIASVLGNLLNISNTDLYHPPYGYGNKPTAPDPNDPSVVDYPDGSSYMFSDLAAIMAQVKAGSKVINLSWGPKDYKTVDKATSDLFKAFFERMSKDYPDVLFVAAAGNDGQAMDGEKHFPGGFALPNLVTVGNVTNDGEIWTESNTPSDNFEVTIYAPGEQSVRGYDPTSGTVTNNHGGTSMATPQVAAAAALIKSINPNLDASQIKQILATSVRENDYGDPILAVDEAVYNAINLNRELAGLSEISREELVKAGTINAVAIPVPDAPNEYMVKAILESPNTPTVIVSVTPSSGTIEEGDSPRSVDGVSESAWLVKMDDDKGTITVHRKDNGAGSLITLEKIDINGHWEGSITFSDVTVDTNEVSPEETEGCDLGMLDLLRGKTVPMTIDFTVDESGSGQATVLLDMASLNEGRSEEEGKFVSEPFTTQVTYSGGIITFTMGEQNGIVTGMSGTVGREGSGLVIAGSLTAKGPGLSLTAGWTVTKQE